MAGEIKVFISYAREDYKTPRRLYDNIKAAGVTPWIDTKDILIGENWKLAIQRALKGSTFFLALLSSNSVNKRGFVQKELKMAIDILDEVPEPDIFLVPVRIDECMPRQERFKDFHWGDLFPSYEKGLKEILRVFSLKAPVQAAPEQSAGIQGPSITKAGTDKPKSATRLRSDPRMLSDEDVMELIKKHDFFCQEYDWTKKMEQSIGQL